MDLLILISVSALVGVVHVSGQQPVYYQQASQVYYPQVQYPVVYQQQQQPYPAQVQYPQQPQYQQQPQQWQQTQQPQQPQQYQQSQQVPWQEQNVPPPPLPAVRTQHQPQLQYPSQPEPQPQSQPQQKPPPPSSSNAQVEQNAILRRDLPTAPQEQFFSVDEVKVVRSRHRGNNPRAGQRRGRHQPRVIDVDSKARQDNLGSDPKTGTDEFKPTRLIRTTKLPLSSTTPLPVTDVPSTGVPTLAPLPSESGPQEKTVSPASSGSSSKKPNDVFFNCCSKRNVDKNCESRCNFEVLNKKVGQICECVFGYKEARIPPKRPLHVLCSHLQLTGMFLGTDPCPQRNGLTLLSCAAQDSDHTTCCRKKGVASTAAGDKCLAFCQMTPGSHFQADISYLPCWGVLNDIKTCFKEAIANDPN